MVVDAAKGVPVIATGGITNKRTVKAAFDLGAEGIYAGTAFLAAKESRLAENIKEKMVDTGAEDMIMFRVPNSFYRSMPGKLPDKLLKMDKEGLPQMKSEPLPVIMMICGRGCSLANWIKVSLRLV